MNRFFLSLILFFSIITLSSCNQSAKSDNDKKSNNNLLVLALASQSSSGGSSSSSSLGCTAQYTGLACIPDSLTATATTGTKNAKTLVLGDTTYTKLADIYNPVRATIKVNRDVMQSIGKLIISLRNVTVTDAGLTGSATWGSNNTAAKYRYRKSTVLSGGKHLEIWWNSTTSPYLTQKAFEMHFIDNGDSSKIEGLVWARFESGNTTTPLGIAHVDFASNPTTGTKTSAMILTGFNSYENKPEKTYFYSQQLASGITKIDGTFTITDYAFDATKYPNEKASRAYTYTAAGDAKKGVVSIAAPLITNTSTNVYDNGNIANISEIWTNYILFSLGKTEIDKLKSYGCTLTYTDPILANPTTQPTTTSTMFKSCLDKLGESVL